MLSYFAPDLQLDSVLDLSPDYLHGEGLQGLLLDLDCTLKDYHAPELSAAVLDWIEVLRKQNIRLCLFSNGTSKKIGRFAKMLDMPFIAKAFKPLPFGCHRASKKLKLPCSEIAVVGDQVFADVLAGRLAGLFTILVKPTSPLEPWFTRLKRPMERHYLRWWNGKYPPGKLRRRTVPAGSCSPASLQTYQLSKDLDS